MRVEQRRDECDDEFPVGMRVLAVDDDPICLTLLETLLTKCQYNVTTTNQAIRALEMLREDKNKFDIVISDVHMPDMDGFKLLELVGLEMDLPVIMLSANCDTKLVMKGIAHGACDYLVKPVRMEELRNIWQHVVRRKRFDSGDQRNGRGSGNSNTEANNENDDPSSRKRPRVIWSKELHRKFVAAVNQLGFDNAGPKKILELMNAEKLTRENVASHLQKYRQYLKRISFVANQRANTVAALGGPDSTYVRMTSVNFHGFQNNALRSIPPCGVLGRLNTQGHQGHNGLTPSSMVQLGHSQIPRQPNLLPVHQTRTMSSNAILSGSSNSLHGLPKSSIIVQERALEGQNHDIFRINSDMPPYLLDHNRCSSVRPNAMENNTSYDIPVNISGQTQLHASRMDRQCEANFGLIGDNIQVWDDNRMDFLNQVDFVGGSGNASVDVTQGAFPCAVGLNRNTTFGASTQPRISSIGEGNNLMFEKSKQGPFKEQERSFGDYGSDGGGSLEDVVTAVFKKQEHDQVKGRRFPA